MLDENAEQFCKYTSGLINYDCKILHVFVKKYNMYVIRSVVENVGNTLLSILVLSALIES